MKDKEFYLIGAMIAALTLMGLLTSSTEVRLMESNKRLTGALDSCANWYENCLDKNDSLMLQQIFQPEKREEWQETMNARPSEGGENSYKKLNRLKLINRDFQTWEERTRGKYLIPSKTYQDTVKSDL